MLYSAGHLRHVFPKNTQMCDKKSPIARNPGSVRLEHHKALLNSSVFIAIKDIVTNWRPCETP